MVTNYDILQFMMLKVPRSMTYKYHLSVKKWFRIESNKNKIDNQNQSFQFNYRFKLGNRFTTSSNHNHICK